MKTRTCAWEQPTKIRTVKSTRKNSSREQITETTTGEGTKSFLTHHTRDKGDRSQADKEEVQEQIPPTAHRLQARTKAKNQDSLVPSATICSSTQLPAIARTKLAADGERNQAG
jgi:hypothetical protein